MFKSFSLLWLFCLSFSLQSQIPSIEDPRLEKAYALYLDNLGDNIEELDIYLRGVQSDSDLYHYLKAVVYSYKELFSAASKELDKISPGFALQDEIKLIKGNNALIQENYAEAIKLYEKIQDSKVLDAKDRLNVINNLGLAYNYLNKWELAEEYFQHYIELIDEEERGEKASALSNLADVYYQQYKDSLAIPLFQEAYKLALDSDYFELKRAAALNMAVVEKNRSDYKKSLEYYEEYTQWKDSIWNRDKIYEQLNAEKELAVEIKEAEIRYEKQSKIFFITLAFLAIGLGGGAFLLFRRTKQLNMDLHLIYSVLSHDLRTQARSLLSPGGEQQKAQALNHSLNNILFWTMDQSDQLLIQPRNHPLQVLVDSVLLDFEDRFDQRSIEVSLSGELDSMANFDMESVKIMLRNLFDNALKYAPTNAELKIAIRPNQLVYTNSGMVFTADQKAFLDSRSKKDFVDRKKGIGMGMSIIKKMANKNGITLQVTDLESGDSALELRFKATKAKALQKDALVSA